MDGFLVLPRYRFNRATIEHAPEKPGVYGLFQGEELIFIGRAADRGEHSIRELLRRHQDGAFGDCTMKATHYTWEISIWPAARETELLARHYQAVHSEPRCQHKVNAA